MASPTPTKFLVKEMVTDVGNVIQFFSDGTIERPNQSPFVQPTSNDPQTGLSSKDIVIPHNPNPISARLYLPKITNQSQNVPILVYFHGGAFIFESAFSNLYDQHFKTFVPQANVLVISVEYSLAPEHPLPTCYNECWAVVKWVCSHINPNNNDTEPWLVNHGDFNKIFIGGDSAGANIAHNIVIRAGTEPESDLSNVKILGSILTHPYFQSSDPIGSEPKNIEPQNNKYHTLWYGVYPGAPGGIDNPMVNPLGPDAPSLDKLGGSKMIVCVAGIDKLRDRGVWYSEAVKKSGWKGKLELFEEEQEDHVYHLRKPESESATKLINRLVSFLQE